MIVMNPTRAQFAAARLENVSWIALDRMGGRLVREWTDEGSFPAFVDVPEQSVSVTLVQELTAEDLGTSDGLTLGSQGALSFVTAPGGSDQARRRVSIQVVLVNVTHSVSRRRATRTLVFEGVSATGGTDPVTISDAGAT